MLAPKHAKPIHSFPTDSRKPNKVNANSIPPENERKIEIYREKLLPENCGGRAGRRAFWGVFSRILDRTHRAAAYIWPRFFELMADPSTRFKLYNGSVGYKDDLQSNRDG